MKRIIFTLIVCTCLFLGIFIIDSQPIIVEYRNLEKNYFIGSEGYQIPKYNVGKAFNSYEEIIEKARSKSDSFIIVAKQGSKTAGVYYENFDWELPLTDGRIFNRQELESTKQYVIGEVDAAIGHLPNNKTIYNLKSLPLEIKGNDCNVSILSNIELAEGISFPLLNEVDNTNDLMRSNYIAIFYLLLIINLGIYLTAIYREIVVYKFLSKSPLKVFGKFIIKVVIGMTLSFALAGLVYKSMFPNLFLISFIRNEIFAMIIKRYLIVLTISLVATIVITLFYSYLPVKRIEGLGVYDD